MASIVEAARKVAIPRTATWGVGLAGGTAVISGCAIWLNGFAVKLVPDAALYTTLKNGVAAVILVALMAALIRPGELRAIRGPDRLRLVLIGIVGGSVPFVLFFSGLAMASAPSAAFIQKTLFVWVALLAVPFLGERLGWVQIAALGALLVGQAILLPPQGIAWGAGETLIAAATLLWAVEVILAKRVLASVGSPIVGAARMAIGLGFLVGYLVLSGRLGLVASVTPEAWLWVLATGVVLAGYVATWYAALERAPASLVTSVLVAGAIITGVLGAISNGVAPAPQVVVGYAVVGLAAAAFAGAGLRARPRPGTAAA